MLDIYRDYIFFDIKRLELAWKIIIANAYKLGVSDTDSRVSGFQQRRWSIST